MAFGYMINYMRLRYEYYDRNYLFYFLSFFSKRSNNRNLQSRP